MSKPRQRHIRQRASRRRRPPRRGARRACGRSTRRRAAGACSGRGLSSGRGSGRARSSGSLRFTGEPRLDSRALVAVTVVKGDDRISHELSRYGAHCALARLLRLAPRRRVAHELALRHGPQRERSSRGRAVSGRIGHRMRARAHVVFANWRRRRRLVRFERSAVGALKESRRGRGSPRPIGKSTSRRGPAPSRFKRLAARSYGEPAHVMRADTEG